MKKVIMIKGDYCPYCKRAFSMMEEIFKENPNLKEIELELIDETTEQAKADQYPYEYVPCYIIDGKIVFEGVPTKEAIIKVFEAAQN
jgi:thioredoxin 1